MRRITTWLFAIAVAYLLYPSSYHALPSAS